MIRPCLKQYDETWIQCRRAPSGSAGIASTREGGTCVTRALAPRDLVAEGGECEYRGAGRAVDSLCGDELGGEDAAVLDPDDEECQCLSSSSAVKKPSSDSEVQDACVVKEESEIERDRGSDDDVVVVVVVDDVDEEEEMDALDVKESSAPRCAAVVQTSSSPCSTTSARACARGTCASSSTLAAVPAM